MKAATGLELSLSHNVILENVNIYSFRAPLGVLLNQAMWDRFRLVKSEESEGNCYLIICLILVPKDLYLVSIVC